MMEYVFCHDTEDHQLTERISSGIREWVCSGIRERVCSGIGELHIPEHTRSLTDLRHVKAMRHSLLFRSIAVHFYRSFSYLCTGINNRTSTTMAGTVKDMSLIKQVLQLKQLGESNRGVSRKLPIDKETVTLGQ